MGHNITFRNRAAPAIAIVLALSASALFDKALVLALPRSDPQRDV